LDAELQSEFVEIEIQACNLGFDDIIGHILMGFNGLNGITSDELTLSAALTVSLEDIDRFDVILDLREESGLLFNSMDGIYDQAGKEISIGIDQFAGHGGLGAVEKGIIAE